MTNVPASASSSNSTGAGSSSAGNAQASKRMSGLRPDPLILIAFVVIGTAVAWFRMPPLVENTVWAEDGHIFLQAAITGNQGSDLFAAYEGYLQFVPRLLADFAVLFGIGAAGVVINLAACFVVGCIAAAVYFCTCDLFTSHWLRAGLASITILAPLLPHEVLGNAANIHWFFLWLTPWLLIYRPRNWRQGWVLGVLALIGSLSEIQMIVFIPLVLLHFRDRKGWPVRAGLIVGLVAQIVVTVLVPRGSPESPTPPSIFGIIKGFITQAVLPTYTSDGAVLGGVSGSNVLTAVAGLAFLPVIAALIVTIWRGSFLQKVASISCVAGAGVIWSAGVYLNHWGPSPFGVVRYGIVPNMLLIASVVIAVQVLLALPRVGWRRLGVVVIAILGVLVLVSYLPWTPDRRAGGPAWTAQVQHARETCESTPGGSATLATAPVIPSHVWVVVLPCGRLDP